MEKLRSQARAQELEEEAQFYKPDMYASVVAVVV